MSDDSLGGDDLYGGYGDVADHRLNARLKTMRKTVGSIFTSGNQGRLPAGTSWTDQRAFRRALRTGNAHMRAVGRIRRQLGAPASSPASGMR